MVWAPDRAETPEAAIYQALGAASVCWDNMTNTGEFQSDRALEIAGGLIKFLKENPL